MTDVRNKRPTGFQITIEPEVLWMFVRAYGGTSFTQRRRDFNIPGDMDKRVTDAYVMFSRTLEDHGYAKTYDHWDKELIRYE